jgi:molecular chaperone DnaJ
VTAQREWFEKDYYKVLGVVSTATDKEITRSYRKLAKQYHPDANPGSEERFKEISTAYDVLGEAQGIRRGTAPRADGRRIRRRPGRGRRRLPCQQHG